MAEQVHRSVRVADSDALPEQGRLVVDVDGLTVGIFRVDGRLYAYENSCAHQGGPVCQGKIVPRVVESLDGDGKTRHYFADDDLNIVCPWHGYEYRITTGEHAGVSDISLMPVPIEERDGGIHVLV